MRIACLACPDTLPGSPTRRPDAFEHDLQFGALREGLAGSAAELVELDWHAPLEAFAAIDLVLIGSAWDYTDCPEEFLARLEALEAMGVVVCNPSPVVRWNADKRYLEDLAEAGAPSIPTLWHHDPGAAEVLGAFDHFGCDRVVIKRRVGAGAIGQHSFTRKNPPPPDWRMGQAAMVQPFLPAIADEGEISFLFLDGEFSHGILKQAMPGDYRIQSLYGGTERAFRPQLDDIARAAAVIAAIPFATPLYARIDMVRGLGGELCLIEAELIEPYLYPLQRRDFGKAFARAVLARLAAG